MTTPTKRTQYTHVCETCKKQYTSKQTVQRFCSRPCKADWQRGRKWGKGKTQLERVCEKCNGPYVTTDPRQRFCSSACWYSSGAARTFKDRQCPICETTFYPSSATQVYCSKRCTNKGIATARRTVQCETCRKEFETNRRGARFCSIRCRGVALGVQTAVELGSRRMHTAGYVEIKTGVGTKGWQLEHRAVMEAHLGRALLPVESVHHINGDRADNRLENLEVWTKAHPAGKRIEDVQAYIREMSALYGTGRDTLAHCPSCTCFGGTT